MKKAQKIAKYSVIFAVLTVIVGVGVLYHQSAVSELNKELKILKEEVAIYDKFTSEYSKMTPEAVLLRVNELRLKANVAPISIDEKLNASAYMKARDMADNNYFDHVNPKTGKRGYGYVNDVYQDSIYTKVSENIAMTSSIKVSDINLDNVMYKWQNSKSHYEGMIDPEVTKMGYATVLSKRGDLVYEYSVQHFCKECN